MTMLEKVARAIHQRRTGGAYSWEMIDAGWRNCLLLDADAALSALETPDEGMVEAGAAVFGSHYAGAETARAVYRAMIRKAREDGK